MAFNVDDYVSILPADKKHPATQGNGFGIVLDTDFNGVKGRYRVAISGLPGFLYLLDETDLAAAPMGISGSSRATSTLPKKKKS